jgi:hypothetical protein
VGRENWRAASYAAAFAAGLYWNAVCTNLGHAQDLKVILVDGITDWMAVQRVRTIRVEIDNHRRSLSLAHNFNSANTGPKVSEQHNFVSNTREGVSLENRHSLAKLTLHADQDPTNLFRLNQKVAPE